MTDNREPQPSRPTWDYGAPDLGLGWNWADADSRPEAWRAFGEDNDTPLTQPKE